jgi:glycosyltransferase involved in cell wall biosynthesis
MTGRIRVLMFVSGFAIGQPLGGAERFGVELARHLEPARFEPIVCGFWRRRVPAEEHWRGVLEADGIETFEAVDRGHGFTPARYAHALRNISGQLRGRPVDVIHSQFQLGSITAMLLRGALGTRVLVRTAHNAVEWSHTPQGFACRQTFTKWAFPLAFDAEVGVSQGVVDSLDRHPGARLARRHARLCYNGISLKSSCGMSLDLRSELGLSAADTVIGSVGRLSKEKGYTYLLQATPAVLAQRPDVKFLLVGDGELRDDLQQQAAQLGVASSVIFAGVRQDVAPFYGIMDLFVLPSLWEGLPTVILESMAAGVPVVATDVRGTSDLVKSGSTGWLCRPCDPAGLAAALLDALNDPPKWTEVAQTARDTVVPSYSLDRIADQYEELYMNLLASQRDMNRK